MYDYKNMILVIANLVKMADEHSISMRTCRAYSCQWSKTLLHSNLLVTILRIPMCDINNVFVYMLFLELSSFFFKEKAYFWLVQTHHIFFIWVILWLWLCHYVIWVILWLDYVIMFCATFSINDLFYSWWKSRVFFL